MEFHGFIRGGGAIGALGALGATPESGIALLCTIIDKFDSRAESRQTHCFKHETELPSD